MSQWSEMLGKEPFLQLEELHPVGFDVKEYKKEQLIQALIKELGTSQGKPQRIRKVVDKFY